MKFKAKYLSDMTRVGNVLKNFHIKPVKEIKFHMDPFYSNTASLRCVMDCIHTKKVLKTSVAKISMDIKNDASNPELSVLFNDDHRVIFKTEHLKAGEIMERLDAFCKAKDTSIPEADLALTKMSGKPKKKGS